MKLSFSLLTIVFALSCANGTPADQGAPVHNEEFGLTVTFPDSARVCTAFSGKHPSGFYIWLNRVTDCDAAKAPSDASISVTAGYNAAFERSPTLYSCSNGSVPTGYRIDLAELSFPGQPSARCAAERDDGSIEVFVSAQAGTDAAADLAPEIRGSPSVNYDAWLRTRPERLERDLATFRQILLSTTLRPPAPPSP